MVRFFFCFLVVFAVGVVRPTLVPAAADPAAPDSLLPDEESLAMVVKGLRSS